MIEELLDVWLTRLREDVDAPPDQVRAHPLAVELRDPARPSNLLVVGDTVEAARAATLECLRAAAHADLYASTDYAAGWLAVDVPVPHRVDATVLIHRMIRRLYFAAVLHGLAEVPAWREAVQSLRLSYLQTRGRVTSDSSEDRSGKLGAEFGFSFSLTEPIKAKLTASEEVKVAQRLSAAMERLDLFEAEDQLLYDLKILAALEAHVDYYARFADPRLPRWEHVRGFFKAAYAKLGSKRRFVLKPVFVFEIHGVTALISVLSLLAQAAAVASGQGARLILVGDRSLAAAWAADRELGSPLMRGAFTAFDGVEGLAAAAPALGELQTTLIRELVDKDKSLGAEIRAVLGAMVSRAQTPRS